MSDPRDIFIRKVVPGCTFAEVGGLWGLVNEKISVAALAGATEVTQIDAYDGSHEAWQEFRNRCNGLKVSLPIECVSGDFQLYQGKSFDVIHSGGVIYHLPNPFLYLAKLREKAKRNVILTSLTVPTEIENQFGKLTLPSSGALFVPALSENDRQILGEFWGLQGLLGITTETEFRLDDYGPFWWLTTESVLKKMCEVAGFKIQEEAVYWPDHGVSLLLS